MVDLGRVVRRSLKRVDYRLPYRLSRARRLFGSPPPPKHDLVFIVSEECRGWILEGLCREIARYLEPSVKYTFHYSLHDLPSARWYYVSHYSVLPELLKKNPILWDRKIAVWYTHPRRYSFSDRELAFALNRAERVIAANGRYAHRLVTMGVRPQKVVSVLGGADPRIFKGHQRRDGCVGISAAFYRRKRPRLILELARRMPHRRFLLLGRGWQKFAGYAELRDLPNLEYRECPYDEYPEHYSRMDVFLNTSRLEGGPIPLIEAMMSNAVPVSSRTGFAEEIIKDGSNGYLFQVDAGVEEVADLVDRAFRLEGDIRGSVLHLTWQNFSRAVQSRLGLDRRSDHLEPGALEAR